MIQSFSTNNNTKELIPSTTFGSEGKLEGQEGTERYDHREGVLLFLLIVLQTLTKGFVGGGIVFDCA
jgi:hypothetical protein